MDLQFDIFLEIQLVSPSLSNSRIVVTVHSIQSVDIVSLIPPHLMKKILWLKMEVALKLTLTMLILLNSEDVV